MDHYSGWFCGKVVFFANTVTHARNRITASTAKNEMIRVIMEHFPYDSAVAKHSEHGVTFK